MARKLYDEAMVDDLTWKFLSEVDKQLTSEGIRFWASVGYSTASAHAGTHAGDGMFDIHGSTRTWSQCVRTAEVIRSKGGFAWARNSEHGGMIQHVHGRILNHPGLPPAGRQQAQAYLDGYNGLGASSRFRKGPDYHTRQFVNVRWFGLAVPATTYASKAALSTLNIGSRGTLVAQLQSWLNTKGYSLNNDGVFGPDTAGAVKAYKVSVGLYPDSEVNSIVWDKFIKLGFNQKPI